jgi:cytoskeletal protein CcmA (bactofilin family)
MSNHDNPMRLIEATKVAVATNFVPKGAVLKGDLQATESIGMRIEGEFTGKIEMQTGGFLHIAASATVQSEALVADYIFVEGSFSGSLHARKAVELARGSKVNGTVKYDADLDIQPGARVSAALEFVQDAAG